MKLFSILIVTICISLQCIAQTSIYDYMPLGKYHVGYTEDLLYIENSIYEQFGYSGKAPMFIRIWHPLESEIKGEQLSYNELILGNSTSNLKLTQQNLVAQFSNSIYETVFKYNIETGEEINYIGLMEADLIGKLSQLKLKSKSASLTKNKKYPVIIYHHGTQGSSIENVAMAEYFASRGYIFIAANFHLPYVNQIYGLEESVKADFNGIKTLTNYARNIAGNIPLIYIGHSWGAQVGWCYLHETQWVEAFISMETTIEPKTNDAEIKDKWPFVYDALKTKAEKFEIPILMLANEPKNNKFPFFEHSNLANTYYVSPKIDFAHESYTSIFFTRYFLKDEISVPDKIELENQLKSYINHLEFMDEFLKSVINKKKFKSSKFKVKFNIVY